MVGNYNVITLCGSTRFKDEFMEAQKRLTLEGNIVISVGLFGHSGDSEVWENMDEGTLTKTKEMLDDMHKRKIDMCDWIYVINVDCYIGSSTLSEIEYAREHGKGIRFLFDLSQFDGKRVRVLDRFGETHIGLAEYESPDYCFHEYGEDEPAIMLGNLILYESQIRSIEEAEPYRFYGWESADVEDEEFALTPCDYYDLLSQCWCAETCAPRMRADWTPENKTLGQCSITAFLMQDLFGGKVLGVPLSDGNYHCFNVVDGCLFDLTSEQFGDTILNYQGCPEQSREVHFAKAEKKERYERLKRMLMEKLGSEDES